MPFSLTSYLLGVGTVVGALAFSFGGGVLVTKTVKETRQVRRELSGSPALSRRPRPRPDSRTPATIRRRLPSPQPSRAPIQLPLLRQMRRWRDRNPKQQKTQSNRNQSNPSRRSGTSRQTSRSKRRRRRRGRWSARSNGPNIMPSERADHLRPPERSGRRLRIWTSPKGRAPNEPSSCSAAKNRISSVGKGGTSSRISTCSKC